MKGVVSSSGAIAVRTPITWGDDDGKEQEGGVLSEDVMTCRTSPTRTYQCTVTSCTLSRSRTLQGIASLEW